MALTSRNRVIYSVLAAYASNSPATGYMFSSGTATNPTSGVNLVNQIPRVQSLSTNFSIARQDVVEFGQLAAIDRIILESPTVSLDLNYNLVDGRAENYLGFAAKGNTTFISGLLDKTQDEKNYFLMIAPEGQDANTNTDSGNHRVIAVGNGFISNYNLTAAVGQFPQASITIEALNARFDTGSMRQPTPAVNPLNGQLISGPLYTLPSAIPYTGTSIVSSLRPGNLNLEFPQAAAFGTPLSGAGSVNIQSVSVSIPLARENINRLGSPFAFAKEITFPVTSTMTLEALVADIQTGSLSTILCSDVASNFKIRMRKPVCDGIGDDAIIIDFKNAKMSSQGYDFNIGSNATTTITFENQIQGITTDTTNGFYFSGYYGE